MYQFRIHHSTITKFIPQVLDAIYTVFKDDYLQCQLVKKMGKNYLELHKLPCLPLCVAHSQFLLLQSPCLMFSFHFISCFQLIFYLSLAVRLIYTCSLTMFSTRSQNNVLWIVSVEELKIVCFYMIVSMGVWVIWPRPSHPFHGPRPRPP